MQYNWHFIVVGSGCGIGGDLFRLVLLSCCFVCLFCCKTNLKKYIIAWLSTLFVQDENVINHHKLSVILTTNANFHLFVL